jgi:hypothetical protein
MAKRVVIQIVFANTPSETDRHERTRLGDTWMVDVKLSNKADQAKAAVLLTWAWLFKTIKVTNLVL